MTEAEWRACRDPEKLFAFLPRKASERKLRLFACALYRSSPRLPGDERCGVAVDAAEQFADGLADKQELASARAGAQRATERLVAEGWAMAWLAWVTRWACAEWVSASSWLAAARRRHEWGTELWEERPAVQCALLRDIFGPAPFRPPAVAPSLLKWNDWCVPRIAQGIYDERAFERMPVLHDALLDAGCADEAILRHCRQRGGHVIGCFVIDLLTGRE